MDWDEELKRQAAISALLAPPEDGQPPLDTKVDEQVTTQPDEVKPETKSDWHKLADQIFDTAKPSSYETKTDQQVVSDYPAVNQNQGIVYPTVAQDQGQPDKKYDTQVAESVVPYGEREKPEAPKSDYAPKDTGKGAAPEDYPTIAQDQGAGESSGQQAPDALTQVERGELWRLPWHPSKQTPAVPSKYPAQIVTPDEAAGKTSVVNAPPAAAPAAAPAPTDQLQSAQPQTAGDWSKLADSIFPSAKSASVSAAVPASTGTLEAGEGSQVDPQALYGYLLNKFSDSGLVGYVPPDGARWGIKTGSAAEWAAFGLAVAKQESGFNARSYNASDPGGSAGLFQFGQGQTQFTKGGNQFDPQESADAFVRSVQHYVNGGSVANLGETFGSIRRPNEAGQYIPWAQGVAGQAPAAAPAGKEDWTKLADTWIKASPEELAAGQKQNVATLDNLNRNTQNPGEFWQKISKPVQGIPDDLRQQYADNFKKEVIKNAQEFYGEKDPEKAFARATSDPGFEAYVSNVGRGLAGAVGQADIGIGLMGKNIDNNRVDGFAKLVHPESTGEGRAGFIKTLTDIQDVHHRHDVFNEIYGNLPQNTKDAIGDPASILDSIDHLADPKYQADLNKSIAVKKAWVDQQLAGDPSLKGVGNFLGHSADWWTTGTGENIFNTIAAIVPGGIGAVVRTSTLGAQIYSSNMDRIAQEHPSWSSAQVSDEASRSAFLQLAPQEAVMAASHGLTAPLLKWAGALAEKPIVRFGIGGGVQVGAAAIGGAAGQVGENVAENKPLLTNVPQAAGSAVVQSLPFAVHGGIHGVAEGPPVKPEVREPTPDIPLTENTKLPRNVVGGAETAVPSEPTPILTPNRAVRTSDVLGPEPGPRQVSTSDVLGPQEDYTPKEPLPWYKEGVAPADRQDPLVIRGAERGTFTPQELSDAVSRIPNGTPEELRNFMEQLQSPTGLHLGEDAGGEIAQARGVQKQPGPVQFWKSDKQRTQAERAWIKARGGESIAEQIARERAAAKLGSTPRPAQAAVPEPPPAHDYMGENAPPPRPGSADRMTGGAGVEEPWVSNIANKYVRERMAAGEIGHVEPGIGRTTEEMLMQGLKMKPEEINQHMSDIMSGKGDPVAQTAAMRAEEARLSHRNHETSLIAEADPNNSAKQIAADNALKDLTDLYNGPMKRLKQNWHRQGVGFQDRIPIDLSTYNGIRAEFIKSTGKKEVPVQAEEGMRKSAAQVRKAGDNLKAKMQKLGSEAEKNAAKHKLPSIDKVTEDVMKIMGHDPCPA